MKITLLSIGKTTDSYLLEGMNKYLQRIKHYIVFKTVELPELKNTKSLSQEQQKSKEATLILKNVSSTDHLILLDERGQELSSVNVSALLNQKLVGGTHQFDPCIYNRANYQISLSKMTFSHQMVRLFFVEQLYRAYTILKGEPYHHQ